MQKQDGINNQQAGRDIIHQGINASHVVDIVQSVLNTVYNDKVEIIVAKYMQENMKIFSTNLLEMISIDELSRKIIESPSLAFIIERTIRIVGEKGDKLDVDTLLKLISERINSNENSFIEIVSEQAIENIDKITNIHISLLTFIQIIQNMKFSADNIEELKRKFNYISPLINDSFKISESNKKYLASLGLLEINILKGNNTKDKFYQTYNKINPDIDKDEFISTFLDNNIKDNILYNVYEAYESCNLYQIQLTTVGEIIALSNIKKLYPDLDIKTWIY